MPTLISPERRDTPAKLPILPYAAGDRRWSVGTLSYTAAGLAVLFTWLLLGDFTLNMKERAINPIAMVMLRGFTAQDWLVGLLVGSIPSAIGLLLVPVISVKSDRFRSRWGRRIPFLLLPTPFILLAMMGLAVTPDLGAWLHHRFGAIGLSLRAGQIGAFAFFWTAMEIAAIIALSLFGALINDVVPQVVIGRFFALFRAVGLIAGIVFHEWLFEVIEAHSKLLLTSLAILYFVGFGLMCLKVKEGQYPPPPTEPGKTYRQMASAVFAYLKECYGNPFFLCFFLASTLGGLSLAPVNTFSVYHAHSVNMSDAFYGHCIALSYCFSLLLAYPLGILADRFHPVRMGIATMAAYALVTAFGFFSAFTATTFSIAFLLHTVISGCYITATASIAQRLLPREKFAEIASAGGIIGGVIAIFVAPALGLFIGWMNHQYRYVFLLASITAALSCATYIILLQRYNALGGDRSFVPPQ